MEILRTESLHLVRDGMLAGILDQKLADIYADCVERPTLEKARTVTLSISIKPTGDSPLDEADISFSVAKKIPGEGFNRRMRAVSRSKGFAFEQDTDSTKFADGQAKFED